MAQSTNIKKGICMKQNPPSQFWQHMEIIQKIRQMTFLILYYGTQKTAIWEEKI
jgi:hypothetical protein